MAGLESTTIVNLSKVEEALAELKDGQKAIGQTLVEIKDRQAAQNDMLADINVALANGFGSIKSELTSIGYGIGQPE